MAKPIKATPDLVGEEADKFIKNMISVESSRTTLREKQIAKKVLNLSNNLIICD